MNRNAFKNGFEFHNRIIQTNLRMIDQHTRYHGPYTDPLNYYLPVSFTITNTSDSEYAVKIISEPFHHVYNHFTSFHSYFSPEDNVTHIKIHPHVDYIEKEKLEKTLARSTNKHVSKYRSPTGQLSYSLSSIPYILQLDLYRSAGSVEATLNYVD